MPVSNLTVMSWGRAFRRNDLNCSACQKDISHRKHRTFFFFFAHTNRIFAHHLDHSSDLALCNLVHFLKMKNKLMGHCLDTLEEIQRVSRMELDALTECDCEKCDFFPTVALRSTSTCHRHSIRHHSSSFEAVKTIFYVVRMLQLVLMNLIWYFVI